MTWLSFVVAVFPSSPLLVLLLLLSLLASLVSSGLTSDCLRWNCPCTGDTLRSDGKITIAKRFQLLSRKAQHTRQKAQFLLNRVQSERFRGNQDHSAALRDCTDVRDPSCMETHLAEECLLEGLPIIDHPQDGATIDGTSQNADELFKTTRLQLARIAVFIEQARLDERQHVPDPRHSLHDDLRRLEEEGLYNLLCGLQVNFSRRQIPWHPPLQRGVMYDKCRLLGNRAAIDNRNYMVLYTLDKLLLKITHQFRSLANHRAKRPVTTLARY
ncbi:hypothetical protein NP493_1510g00000 [Ridgeia piscesae]|uniref:Uncharacterized protein n=1 Tax=Ridgeia piscesae TaxID=27915 RepID=A0AAD9K186_RIDPI|nr:hypothetical protein NP493_1510g00000 [Ridgeia piscesae]